MFVLALPLAARPRPARRCIAFVGGLSAATAMVIVETVALAIMVSNDIVVPLVLQRPRRRCSPARRRRPAAADSPARRDLRHPAARLSVLPLGRRRAARLDRPAVLRRRRAARAGLLRRPDLAARHRARRHGRHDASASWSGPTRCCCRASPTPASSSPAFSADGPFGIAMLRPQALFGLDCRRWCTAWSGASALNVLAYVAFSLGARADPIERLQADLFVPPSLAPIAPSFRLWRSSVTVEELTHDGRALSRRGAHAHARSTSFAAEPRHQPRPDSARPTFELLRYRRASAGLGHRRGIVAAGAVAAAAQARRSSTKAALKLLDDANAAIQYNREILQTALDHVRQGIAVFDKDCRLICWNRQFGEILDLPPELDPRRRRARRDRALQRRARRLGAGEPTTLVASGSTATSPAASRSSSASPTAAW